MNWICVWCGDSRIRMIGRGAGRIAQEMGKAFPGVQIVSSTAAHRLDSKPEGKVLVVSTLGCEPEGDYAAAALLDGEVTFNRVDLRTDEIALSRWLRVSSLVADEGEIFITLDSSHPITQALVARNLDRFVSNLLSQRSQVHLPPFYRMATIQGDTSEISKVFQVIKSDDRFEGLGPIPLSAQESKIILRLEVSRGHELAEFLLDFRRLRSIKGLPPLSVRIDPYSI